MNEEVSKFIERYNIKPVNFIFNAPPGSDDDFTQYCFFYISDSEYLLYEDYDVMAELHVDSNNPKDFNIESVGLLHTEISEDYIHKKFEEMISNSGFSISIGDWVSNFKGKHIHDDLVDIYLDLLEQCLVLRCISHDRNIRAGYEQFKNAKKWLESGDFFTSPASTRYHNAEYQGLLIHTLSVYNNMLELRQLSAFEHTDISSAILCCLVHDWCKIGTYTSYKKNIKDETLDDWIQEDAYKRVPSKFPFGHGETSMYMAEKLFHLDLEEALAVRWHMGKYYVDDALNDDLEEACNRYPLVNLLQFADKLSITEYLY